MHVQSHPLSASPFSACAKRRTRPTNRDDAWGWAEVFIAMQLLWGSCCSCPAPRDTASTSGRFHTSSAVRRSCTTSGARPASRFPSTKWLLASFGLLLVLNLLQPTTQLMAGIGQIVFQISIAAPAFWMARAVRSERAARAVPLGALCVELPRVRGRHPAGLFPRDVFCLRNSACSRRR